MADPLELLKEADPWFQRNSGKTVIAFAFLLLLAILGIVPSPTSRALDALLSQHQDMAAKLTVQCVHQAINERERAECITGVLAPRR